MEVVDLNDYQCVKQIRNVGCGEVWIMKNKLNEQMAIAGFLTPNENFNEQMFRDDIKFLQSIDHPCLMKTYGCVPPSNEEKRCIILTAANPNGSLAMHFANEMKGEPVSQWNDTKKAEISIGIASAIEYLHNRDILHKSIIPSNIFFDAMFNPHLCDFGLRQFKPNMLTHSYLAPEVKNGQEYTKKSDIYSYGLILYQLTTKRSTFDANGNLTLDYDGIGEKLALFLMQILNNDMVQRPNISDIVQNLKENINFYFKEIDEEIYNKYSSQFL